MSENKRNLHRWEELFPQELVEIMKETPVVYFPFGCVEEHGTHLALATDYTPVHAISLAVAERAGGIVYPVLPAAPCYFPPLSRHEMRYSGKPLYPPSLFLSRECCRLIYEETLENMAHVGFKYCFAIGGHFPAIKMMDGLATEMGGKIGEMQFVSIDWATMISKSSRFKQYRFAHGGSIETSLVMYCNKNYCDLSKIQDVHQSNFESQLNIHNQEELAKFAKEATWELGRDVFNFVVDSIVKRVEKRLRKKLHVF